jgi:hypothetical protein
MAPVITERVEMSLQLIGFESSGFKFYLALTARLFLWPIGLVIYVKMSRLSPGQAQLPSTIGSDFGRNLGVSRSLFPI